MGGGIGGGGIGGSLVKAITFTVSGGVPTIRKSKGITSLTDHGVGDFTINFSSNFPDIFYYMNFMITITASSSMAVCTGSGADGPLVGSFRVHSVALQSTLLDPEFCSITFSN